MNAGARAVVVGVIVALLVGAGLAHQEPAAPTLRPGGAADAFELQPVATPAGALSSTWYCPAAAADGGSYDASVVVANPTGKPVDAVVTVFAGAVENADPADAKAAATLAGAMALAPQSTTVAVPAQGRAELALSSIRPSPFVAALVEAVGGEVVVERRIKGRTGSSVGPCASSASAEWYLPTGVTTIDAHEYLTILNPFADDAVADVAFVTSDGFRAPPATQGLVLPTRHLSVIDVGLAAGRHDQVATQVRTRRGRVVVGRLQGFDGSGVVPASVTAELAAPGAGPTWVFPSGLVGGGEAEAFVVLNPGTAAATVDLAVTLDDPAVNGTVDPIPVVVPSGAYGIVSIGDQPRVPKGVGHAVVAQVRSGSDVVVERVLLGTGGQLGRFGYAPTIGSRLVARSWVMAEGTIGAADAEHISLFNPSSTTAHASIAWLSGGTRLPLPGLEAVEVPPGGRTEVDLAGHAKGVGIALVVEADRPVVVDRGLFSANGPVQSVTVPVAVPDGLDRAPAAAPPTTIPPAAETDG